MTWFQDITEIKLKFHEKIYFIQLVAPKDLDIELLIVQAIEYQMDRTDMDVLGALTYFGKLLVEGKHLPYLEA